MTHTGQWRGDLDSLSDRLLGDRYRASVALVQWAEQDGKSAAIHDELVDLGYRVVLFQFDHPIPPNVDIVFTFAPHGRLLQIPRQLESMPANRRPVFVHWNLEGIPNPAIPWMLAGPLSAARSWLDRLKDDGSPWAQRFLSLPPVHLLNGRMFRFRIVGEYLYAWSKGWIDLFVDFSEYYADLRRRRGMSGLVVPWGTARDWYEDLKLERDIDVLWMGRQRNRRRRRLLGQVRNHLAKRGVEMYVADNEENPFIFGQERIHFLNRAKVTLNLKTVWYDNVFSTRFHMAAGNRSLVVSESFLPHCEAYKDGVHYVSASPEVHKAH